MGKRNAGSVAISVALCKAIQASPISIYLKFVSWDGPEAATVCPAGVDNLAGRVFQRNNM